MTDKIQEHEFGPIGNCVYCGKTRPEVLVNELTPLLCVERLVTAAPRNTGYAIDDFDTIRTRRAELQAEHDAQWAAPDKSTT